MHLIVGSMHLIVGSMHLIVPHSEQQVSQTPRRHLLDLLCCLLGVQRRRATCCCGKHLLLWKAVRRGGGRLPLEQKRVQVMYTNCREANPSANTANPSATNPAALTNPQVNAVFFSQRSRRQRRDHHICPAGRGNIVVP